MAILNILRYPDPRLHKVATPVTEFGTERLRTLVADMADTMYDAPGVGLAASQVDVHEQVVTIDVTETQDDLMVFINPEITWSSEEHAGLRRRLPVGAGRLRRRRAPVARQGARPRSRRQGVRRSTPMACWPSASSTRWITCKGKVFVEYLSPLKRNRIKAKLQKEERGLEREAR